MAETFHYHSEADGRNVKLQQSPTTGVLLGKNCASGSPILPIKEILRTHPVPTNALTNNHAAADRP